MLIKKWHCKAITKVPTVASTGVQIKFQYLGDLIVELESLLRSAPWGIAYPKGGGSGS